MKNKIKIYFTADIHFGHKNIIKYCNRPYSDVHEMNKALTDNWNSVVSDNDIVYQLGDFAFGTFDKYIHRLNGTIISIRGNHDRVRQMRKFGKWHQTIDFEYDGVRFLLNHKPILPGDKDSDVHLDVDQDDYDWILCGHVHEKWITNGKNINVGVDVWGFKPVSIDQIMELIKNM